MSPSSVTLRDASSTAFGLSRSKEQWRTIRYDRVPAPTATCGASIASRPEARARSRVREVARSGGAVLSADGLGGSACCEILAVSKPLRCEPIAAPPQSSLASAGFGAEWDACEPEPSESTPEDDEGSMTFP